MIYAYSTLTPMWIEVLSAIGHVTLVKVLRHYNAGAILQYPTIIVCQTADMVDENR